MFFQFSKKSRVHLPPLLPLVTRLNLFFRQDYHFFDNVHFWLKLVCFNFCIIICSFFCQFYLHYVDTAIIKRNRPVVFCKKGVLTNSAIFARKQLCWSLFSNKVADLQRLALLKKPTPVQGFSCKFCKLSQNNFSLEPLWTAASV